MAFDPNRKEAELQAQSASWDLSSVAKADPTDVPVVDVGPWFASGADTDLHQAAETLSVALRQVGFHQLVGHQLPDHLTAEILDYTKRFHQLDAATKQAILMDDPGWPVGGVGYLPYNHHKLPRRSTPNSNAAFLIKRDADLDFDANRWLPDGALPGFRNAVESYAEAISGLARRLLPLYATALSLAEDFFKPAFDDPFWRLRLTHYPTADDTSPDDPSSNETSPGDPSPNDAVFGISPHVDTTFMTLLLTDGPGLVIYSHSRQCWIEVPVLPGSFIVNSGELLRQWSNDVVLSTRHFARNPSEGDRYSVPFFYNANADYVMECLPSCHSADNPARYPPISYRQSQGVVQGE